MQNHEKAQDFVLNVDVNNEFVLFATSGNLHFSINIEKLFLVKLTLQN